MVQYRSFIRILPTSHVAVTLLLSLLLHFTDSSANKMSVPNFKYAEEVKLLATSQNNFARDLYLSLSQESGGNNIFFSPFSILTAMGMALMGSRRETEAQMRNTLHLTQETAAIEKAFSDLISDYKREVKEYELRTSNMAYVSDKMKVLDEFSASLATHFLSQFRTVNFDQGEAVRAEINSFVEAETKSRIKDLIPSGLLNSMTRMVLVNAVYFKGTWKKQFDPQNTMSRPFWTSADTSVLVPMMYQEANFRFAPNKELDALTLALDYLPSYPLAPQGSRLSMLILLPNKRDGLAEMERKLVNVDLQELDKRMSSMKVQVSLPKIKLEQSFDLVKVMQKMGIVDLFDERRCDLSGITGFNDLYVSNILHKAFLEVNEEGSEAAAATAAPTRERRSVPLPPVEFVVDHPFLLAILDNASEVVLFIGRVNQPTQPVERSDAAVLRDEL